MAGRARRTFTDEQKRAAAEEVLSGVRPGLVQAKHGIVSSVLNRWRRGYAAGEYGEPKGKRELKRAAKAKANGHAAPSDSDASEGLTPQALFTSRVNRAIGHLRQAYKETERMKKEGKLKGPDKAHSLAYLALLELQGDNAL